jgi:signal transduction histidine kinase
VSTGVSRAQSRTMGFIRVSDNGPGIPPGVAGRVFDRFYQGDPSRSASGTGLGLAIVRAIAEALHGSAEVATSPSGGASILVKVPLAAMHVEQPAGPGPPAPVRSPQLH